MYCAIGRCSAVPALTSSPQTLANQALPTAATASSRQAWHVSRHLTQNITRLMTFADDMPAIEPFSR